MTKLTQVRKYVLQQKIRQTLLAEFAALIALILALLAANFNYLQVQAAEQSASAFQQASVIQTDALYQAMDDQAEAAVAAKAERDAAAALEARRSELVAYALQYQGYNYRYGGTEMSKVPGKGLDCAGFVNYVFAHGAGMSWSSRSVSGLYREIGGTHVSSSDLQKGDILFFGNNSHIAIYAGDGYIIHAMDAAHGITKTKLYTSSGRTYSGKTISDVRRVLS